MLTNKGFCNKSCFAWGSKTCKSFYNFYVVFFWIFDSVLLSPLELNYYENEKLFISLEVGKQGEIE